MARQVEAHIPAYLRQVDKALNDMAGLRYSAIQDDVERLPGQARIDAARSSNVAPMVFAASVHSALSLVPVMDRSDAGDYNKRLIAVAAFAAENPEWTMVGRGAFREYEDGVVRIAPSLADNGSWGFSASHASGATLSMAPGLAELDPRDPAFETSASALDLGDALSKLDNALDLNVRGPGSPR